jgi:ADP-ribose pyrophosphatase YjhB (NUDIX family)
MEDVHRGAARLLVLTPEPEVLLLRLEPSFREPFWVTPGGGLDDGESYEDAARRELAEEVGRDDLTLGPCIWTREVTFTWERWRVHQRERTFLVEVPAPFEAVTVFPDEEPITGSGWFTIDRLRAEPEVVYPIGLADHLERFLADGHGGEPVDLGVVVED